MENTLLLTKLHIPSPRAHLVTRPHLMQRLEEGLRQGSRLTLISAPAGYGKTTLIVEWIQHCHLPAAWISLDQSDSDAIRFIEYLIAALRSIFPNVGEATLNLLEATQRLSIHTKLTPLINEIANAQQSFLLILDDYHLVESQSIHEAVIVLIDHLPVHAHLVIASRADPPLQVALLRGRGQVAEIRLSDLRFSVQEAADFLKLILGSEIPLDIVDALTTRTEGWVAGLQMAAIALQSADALRTYQRLQDFVQAFTGSHHFILDYLIEEVLQRQSAAVQTFLMHTSILDRLCDSLCSAVIGATNQNIPPLVSSSSILEQLDHANLFIIPLDNQCQWYRYHSLFASLLRQRLQQHQPELIPLLHQRASAWYEAYGFSPEAIQHALTAGDFERAAQLIEQNAEAAMMRSEIITLMRWIEQLPETCLHSRPRLKIYHCWGLLMEGQTLDLVEARLDAIVGEDEALALRAAALRSYFMVMHGEIANAMELSQRAWKGLPKNEVFLRSLASVSMAAAQLAEYHTAEGIRLLEEAAQSSRKEGNIMIAVAVLASLAEVNRKQGLLHKVRELAEEALQLAVDKNGRYLPIAVRPLALLGDVEREWNHLEQANFYLDEADSINTAWVGLGNITSMLLLTRARFAWKGTASAQEILDKASRAAKSSPTSLDDYGVAMYQAWLWIVEGKLEQTARWAQERRLEEGATATEFPQTEAFTMHRMWKYECLVLARLYLAQRQPAKALEILNRILSIFEKMDRMAYVIETQALRALALQSLGRNAEATAALKKVLPFAESEGYIRLFVDEGQEMRALLEHLPAHTISKGYLDKLLNAFDIPDTVKTAPAPFDLSERELDVLRLLNSPLSVSEIADKLFISSHTARSHIKAIYSKLGVHTRLEALEQAKELKLLA